MNNSLLPVGLFVCAAAGAVLWWWPNDKVVAEVSPAPTATVQSPAPAPETPLLEARWTAPTTVQNPAPTEQRHMVKLPTGEWIKALNGAVDAKLEWPSDRPYSPIIGVERAPNGQDWWVHADGSKSTTTMVYRSDLGRHDAVGQVANPTASLPMEPSEAPQGSGAPGAGGVRTPGGAAGGVGVGGSSASEIKKH